MEKLTTVEFSQPVSPHLAMEAVLARGACAIHNFALFSEVHAGAELLRSQQMMLDEDMESRVQRRQHMTEYDIGADDVPPVLIPLIAKVEHYVNQGGLSWNVNTIIAHRYELGDFIGKHEDFSKDYGVIAVLTLDGIQDFYVVLDGDDEPFRINMRQGTLTMIRGFDGDPESRPYHWVNPPAVERTAVSMREERH